MGRARQRETQRNQHLCLQARDSNSRSWFSFSCVGEKIRSQLLLLPLLLLPLLLLLLLPSSNVAETRCDDNKNITDRIHLYVPVQPPQNSGEQLFCCLCIAIFFNVSRTHACTHADTPALSLTHTHKHTHPHIHTLTITHMHARNLTLTPTQALVPLCFPNLCNSWLFKFLILF